MTSQEFLWTSVVVALVFVLIFLYPRSKRGPSRLRMFGDNKASHLPITGKFSTMSREARHSSSGDMQTKTLNVMFNYNGHSWDAHEVLGVPAGAPMDMIKAAYQKTLNGSDPSSHDFISTAYNAICNELKGV